MFAVASSTCRSADFSSAWSRSMAAFDFFSAAFA
jgi:hypothetical protein